MSDDAAQLTISLDLNELCDFDNFYIGNNAEVVARLKGASVAGEFTGTWIWGELGRGCSHLLQAACQEAEALGARGLYLPLAELPRAVESLEGMSAELIALDDVSQWLGDKPLEDALVGLYQAQLEAGHGLIVADSRPPLERAFCLADLASRMRAMATYQVQVLDDAGLRVVLRKAARRKGLQLDDAVLDFWLTRSVRSVSTLLEQLDALDSVALEAQRRITVPLIKSVLHL